MIETFPITSDTFGAKLAMNVNAAKESPVSVADEVTSSRDVRPK